MLERSVTRAAAMLAMSQPAVSNALRRARKLTNDELFIKVAEGVRPTSRMLAMWPELRRSLASLRAVVAPQDFDFRSVPTTFRLAITDSLASAASTIALRIRKEAPLARIAFAIHTNASSTDAIERGTLDCAVGMFPALPRTMNVRGLLTDHYVCIMRKGHKLAAKMSLASFVEAEHVLVTPSGQDLGVVDGWLSLQGKTRNITMIVNRFGDALRIVSDSDLISCVPSRFLDQARTSSSGGERLISRNLPFEAEKILYKLVWHERVHSHPAHVWFREIVAEVCEKQASGKDRYSPR